MILAASSPAGYVDIANEILRKVRVSRVTSYAVNVLKASLGVSDVTPNTK